VVSRITSASLRSRGLCLLPAGAFVVHQLRYKLAYGPHASAQLAAQGHSYLDSFAPWLVLLLCLGAGSYLARVAQALASGRVSEQRRSFGVVWAATTVSLVAIYAVQEFLEGLVAVGHPAGVAGIVGHGGWWAGIVALVVGAAIALLLGAARAMIDVASRFAARRRRVVVPESVRAPAFAPAARLRPLAGGRAGRAPPLAA
jgi:hypothetical protein